jgi:dynein heavy chain, axonemal
VIAKVVTPKMDLLRKAQRAVEIANAKLQAAEEELAECQGELDAMQAKFDAALAEKQKLQDELLLTKKRMDSANALIHGLGGEKERWTRQSKEFEDQIARLVGDCALACAFLSYLGPFNKEFREKLLYEMFYEDCLKRSIPVTKDLQITKFLVDASEVGDWTIQGLPTDDLSIQNGILVTRASRWPLLIDPQGQGLNWIKNKEAANMLRVTNLNEKSFRQFLEDCLTFGKPLLIENVEEELDPVLDPVLEKQFVKQGKGWKIVLADKDCDYTDTFRLFITSRLPNPHYTPELSAKITVIDFTVTMKGLEDQLLGRVVLKEKPELQEQRQKLLEEVNSYSKKIKELEDDLLLRLASSEGNLLDDTSLIDVLAATKKTSKEVNEKLKSANETEHRIIAACEEYRPVAARGSVLYFLIAEMRAVNVMYNTSLAQFILLFEASMVKSEKASLASKRIHNIIEFLTYSTFCYICRGYFERHKMLFGLLLSIKILMQSGVLSQEHFDCFVKGGAALDINQVRKKPKEWISDLAWLNVINLSNTIPAFRDIPESIARSDVAWRQWSDLEAPEQGRIPDFEEKTDKFGRLLIIRALKEDRTLIAASDFIADTLGQRYVESTPLNLESVVLDADERTPLLCILSPGSDPSDVIYALAKKKKKDLKSVSMGQGQEVIARRLIDTGVTTGGWVMLNNTHLGLKFLSEVETTLLKREEIDPEFRLWITSETHPKFPIGLLQIAIKVSDGFPSELTCADHERGACGNEGRAKAVVHVG